MAVYWEGDEIAEDELVFISATPVMPSMYAKIVNPSGPGSVTWEMTIVFDRPNRNESASFETSLAVENSWDLNSEWGEGFYGGKAQIKATFGGKTYARLFHIRGTNPTEAAASAYIGATPFYATAIARHESGIQNSRTYLQFNELGTLGPNYNTNLKATPNRSSDGIGWGMYQLTNPQPTRNQVWNWKLNVDAAKGIFIEKNQLAANWIASQEAQQMADDPSKPLQNYTFTWGGVTFRKGTARTPTDACAIEAFNGVSPGWAVWWDRTAKVWKQRDNINNYITAICELIE